MIKLDKYYDEGYWVRKGVWKGIEIGQGYVGVVCNEECNLTENHIRIDMWAGEILVRSVYVENRKIVKVVKHK
tara:strand:- start:1073 stop:1291 length:219 start_codon:yes stop_codon:yes gene_type:complete